MVALTWENADFAWDNDLGLTWSDETFEPIIIGAGYPDPSDVRAGVKYGPNDDYTGTMTSGGASLLYIISTQ